MKVRCNGTDAHNLSTPLKKWKVESGGFPEAGNSANMGFHSLRQQETYLKQGGR